MSNRTRLASLAIFISLVCCLVLVRSTPTKAQANTTYGCYIATPPHTLRSPGDVRIVSSPTDCTVGETAIAWDVFPVGTSPSSVGFDGTNIWVSNSGSNSITKLRASDGANLGTFPAGIGPGKSIFDGQNIWIVNWTANTLTKLRASDGALLATIPVRNAPAGLAFDGTNIWVSFYGNNSVSKLRPSDGVELSNTPGVNSPLDIVFDGVNIWAANNTGGGSVTKIDRGTGAILGIFNTNGGFPGAIAFDGSNVWVTNSGTQTLSKNRVSDGALAGSFPMGFGGSGVVFDGANIWAANEDVVLKYRATDGALLGSFPGSFNGSGRYETAMAFDGTYVWVANFTANTVTRYRDFGTRRTTYGCYVPGNPHPTRAPSDTRIVSGLGDCVAGETAISWDVFDVGATPANISFDGANLWISNAADGTITKIRASDEANLGTFQAGPGPGKSIRIGDSVWIPSYSTNTLRRIDANTGALIQTYPVRRGPVGITTDGTNLWVSYYGDWAVGKIDANTGQELAVVGVPDALDMVFDGTNVWVANNQAGGKLTKIRASDASVQQVVNLNGGFPWSMTFDGTNIWVNCTGTTTLVKVRVSDGAVVGSFGEDFYGFGAAFDGQNVWVPNQTAVLKFRASDGALRGSFPGSVNFHGNYMSGAAFDGTNVWITSLTNNTVTRYHDYGEAPTAPTPTPQLVSEWRMDGSVEDAVSSNNPSATSNLTFEAGRVCQGVRLDANGYLEIPDSPDLRNQHFTVGAWVRPDGPGPNNDWQGSTFIQKDIQPPAGNLGLTTGMWWSAQDLRFRFGVGAPFVDVASTNTFPQGQFYHVVGTYDGAHVRLYVNGHLEAETAAAVTIPYDPTIPWTIGSSDSYYRSIGFSRTFNGVIDEVRIYNGALGEGEVQQLFADTSNRVCDASAPVTAATATQAPNAAGWNNSNVSVLLSAMDESGGSGVASITYSATGAQPIAQTTVSGANSNLSITAEGETTITYFARDNAGNTEGARTLVVRIDRSAPSVSCGSADGAWHANDVSIPCNANDTVSGLANSSDGSFNLTTSVAPNTETANATTDSHNVCDIAGNCATAGPVSGNKVDKKAPVITITTPTAGTYLLNQAVTVNFSCTDGGSGVGACVGTSASGSPLDTASIGAKTFTVNASDNVGNSPSPITVNYTVNFAFTVLFDQTKAHKSSSTVPIKIRLVDANGVNVSSLANTVHAVSVLQVGSEASPIVEDAGNANPDLDFRYDAGIGGYIFNLKTTGYGTGSYLLNFISNGGSSVYSVGFQVRQ